MSETFGAEVRRRRTELGMSQSRLASLAGVSRGTIRNIESGGVAPIDNNLARIREVLASVDPTSEEATYSSPTEFAEWMVSTSRILGYTSNSELARALNVPQPTVSRWKGGMRPGVDHLLKFSSLFGIELKALLAMAGYISHQQARISNDALTPKVPEGHVVVSRADLEAALSGVVGRDLDGYHAAVRRLLKVIDPPAADESDDEDGDPR
jgi:transcriptional regulator with XRE-family HTH domain